MSKSEQSTQIIIFMRAKQVYPRGSTQAR